MSPISEIERDLEWREAEMATLRILLKNSDITEKEKTVLFRAAWALLYAHYEGFCKFALTVYFDSLQQTKKPCRDLPLKTQAFALTHQLKSFRTLPAPELLTKIVKFDDDVMSTVVKFPEVDTESNLWPKTLKALLEKADILLESIEANSRTLHTLVSRRNKIAHGERDIIPEFTYYVQFEDAVKTIMYELALSIDEKLT